MSRACWLVVVAGSLLSFGRAAVANALQQSSCVVCHSDAELFDETSLAIVQGHAGDVHDAAGISCHDCHGGNPDPSLAEDLDAAMDEGYSATPFHPAPARRDIPSFCGRCHSDAAYMKRFSPDVRVDQEQEYWTSHHGEALRGGDQKVATCADCHGVHGIKAAADPESPVYPTRVAETCGSCHADAEHMVGYAIPTDQLLNWRSSVHARALLDKGDLSAPTCNDCHGNHGAAPPGLDSLHFVCGQCHGREAGLFRDSSKHAGFVSHNELLTPGVRCGDCHEAPEPQAAIESLNSFTECATCHGNHAIFAPSIAMFSPLPATPCAFCHEPAGGQDGVFDDQSAPRYRETRDALLAEASVQQLEGDERFDWLLDRALELPFHVRGENIASEGAAPPELRPEFDRLFRKLRLGKTVVFYEDAAGGESLRRKRVSCGDCHGAEPLMADEAAGWTASGQLLHSLHELSSATAQAERLLLAAQRGGVSVSRAQEAIDRAVDSEIELQVLVHTFDPTGEQFAGKHREGMEHARAGLQGGEDALAELRFRRRGLAASLIVIVALLIALALKIRQLGQPA